MIYFCAARGNCKTSAIISSRLVQIVLEEIKIENERISRCPNKRVVYLALHGHGRTRKKNRNRALRWYERTYRR